MLSNASDKTALVIDPLIESIDGQIRRTIETVSSFDGSPRELLCVGAGRALVLLGCSYLGNGMGLADPHPSLTIAANCIEEFRKLAHKAMVLQEIDRLAKAMDPAVLENFRDPERFAFAKSMERCRLNALPEVTGDPNGERCSGQMICDRCGQTYYVHPMDWRFIGHGAVPFLNILCDGRRVKL